MFDFLPFMVFLLDCYTTLHCHNAILYQDLFSRDLASCTTFKMSGVGKEEKMQNEKEKV